MGRFRVLLLSLATLLVAAPGALAQRLPSWAEAPPPAVAPPEGESTGAESPPNWGSIDLPDDPDPIPVDGGLALLALAGAGYAARRLRHAR